VRSIIVAYVAGASNTQRHNGVLLEWEKLKYLNLLTDTSTTSKLPLNEQVCNTETKSHLLPVQGSPAEQVVILFFI